MVAQPQPQPQPRFDPPPVVNSFSANPSYIQPGQTATLTWTVSDVLERNVSVTISPGIGSVPASGSYVVSPPTTTTYTLTATNADGTVSASTTVTVAPPATTLSPSSSSAVGIPGDDGNTGKSGTLALGLGGTIGSVDSRLLYGLLIALLAAAVVAAVVFARRKPALAHAGHSNAITQAGRLACITDTQVADETTHTKPVISGAGPKFVTPDGKPVSAQADSGTLGRKDFRSLLGPEKAALISREHIRLDYEDGQYYIEDCGSTNGTRLNGASIKGKGRQLVKDGDEIELANVLTLTFKA